MNVRHGARRASILAPLLLLAALGAPGCDRANQAEGRAGDVTLDRSPDSAATQPSPVGALIGSRARIVWVQTDGADAQAQKTNIRLMGLDTDDGRGERPILGEPRNYAKPLITPKGDRVVFSNRQSVDIHIVNWDGSGARRLAGGFALAVWTQPVTGAEWLYAGVDRVEDGYRRVVRFPIDEPSRIELVWSKSLVGEDTFQVSRDGRWASGNFPWPVVGVAALPDGEFRRLGDGCWTALSTLDRPVCWYLDGAHRNLTIVDVERGTRTQIDLSSAPGFSGAEIYHPRWLSDPRLFALTGPYNLGGGNQVRGGGKQVEIHVGKFADDLSRVVAWAQVTRNNEAEAFPDVWIDPAGRADASAEVARQLSQPPPAASAARGAGSGSGAGVPAERGRIVLEARLTTLGAVPSPREILPYRHALVVNLYDVVKVVEGPYTATQVLVAEWAIRDSRVVADATRARGTLRQLRLERHDAHPELEGERLIKAPGLPAGLHVYYPIR